MRVMVVVTHLLGTGHLARALTLARAYTAAGDTACVVSGGTAAPMLDTRSVAFIQLPPVKSDGVDFSRLLQSDGAPADAAHMARRKRMLLEAVAEFAPDVLITELFPFGRRILREEFTALLDHAVTQPRPPLVCASLRDILAPPSKPKKAQFAQDTVVQFYDAVLVHSDPALMPLSLSWPVTDPLEHRLHYTGFVAGPPPLRHPQAAGTGEILVSAGGGDVGGPVYEAALDAARLRDLPMRILVGGAEPAPRIAALRQHAPPHVHIEAARPDFRQMLRHAAASVSLCGYNTALDILQAGTPAVFIPFDEGSEVEQAIRARALSAQDGILALPRAALSGARLLEALGDVIAAPPRAPVTDMFDGAARTVTLTRQLRAQM